MNKNTDFSLFVIWPLGLISFSVFLVALYKAEIVFNGFNRSHYYIYYALSFLGIFLSLAVGFLPRKQRYNATIILLGILIGVYISEFIFSNLNFLNNSAKTTEREFLDELNKKGGNAVPRMLPGFFVESNGLEGKSNKIFPLAGISNRLTVHCEESSGMITYLSDRYGFNNPDSVWNVYPEIITVGDSFTQGDCVNQSKTIASNLRTITGKNVINLGMGGNGPLIELATLSEYGTRIRPKYVLWMYFEGNDFFDLMTEQQSDFLMTYLGDNGGSSIMGRQTEVDSLMEEWLKSRDHNRDNYTLANFLLLKTIRSFLGERLYNRATPVVSNSALQLMDKILAKAKKITGSWGGELIFVYLPQYQRYSDNVIDHDGYIKKLAVIQLVKKLKVPIIDVHENLFLMDKDPLRFFPNRKNGHYNEEGYLMISRLIDEKLQLSRIGAP